MRTTEKTKRAAAILELLKKRYPVPETMLTHENPWELMIATILAAQCTDARVNTITPELFRRWPGPAEMMQASVEALESVIRPTGFYHNKAKNILGAARRVTEVFGGEVPQTIGELITIPGVARKTANVLLGDYFNKPEGVVVDTHVKRLSFRLGFTKQTDPVKIEKDLMKLIPKDKWQWIGIALILHGRSICPARKPNCEGCPLAPWCPKNAVK